MLLLQKIYQKKARIINKMIEFSQFCSGLLRAILANNQIGHCSDTQRGVPAGRSATTSGMTRQGLPIRTRTFFSRSNGFVVRIGFSGEGPARTA